MPVCSPHRRVCARTANVHDIVGSSAIASGLSAFSNATKRHTNAMRTQSLPASPLFRRRKKGGKREVRVRVVVSGKEARRARHKSKTEVSG